MNDDKLERQINDAASEAISRIEELEDRVAELEGENSDITYDKDTKIEELEDLVQELRDNISELEERLRDMGGIIPGVTIVEEGIKYETY